MSRDSGPGAADRGLQQERTLLAWRRTGLALVVAAVTIGRLSVPVLGVPVAVPVVAALAASLWVVVTHLRRSRYATTSRREPDFRQVLVDGRLPLVVAGVTAVLCLAESASVLAQLVAG